MGVCSSFLVQRFLLATRGRFKNAARKSWGWDAEEGEGGGGGEGEDRAENLQAVLRPSCALVAVEPWRRR